MSHAHHTHTTPSCQPSAKQVVAAAVAEPYDDEKDANVLYMTPYFVPFKGRLGGLVLFDVRWLFGRFSVHVHMYLYY